MKLTREQLLSIESLELSGAPEDLGAGLGAYCDALDTFSGKYHTLEERLKRACFSGDAAMVTPILAELTDALFGIHADTLASECGALAERVPGLDAEALEAEVVMFLADVSSLCVDILIERYRSENPDKPATRRYPVLHEDVKSVLAVDDVPLTLNTLKTALTSAGYKFSGVTSGAAALDYIEKFTPDLFILDIEMPGMDGFELADKLREAGQPAPIIFLTGNTAQEYLLKAVKAGAADFIVKPVSADRIAAKVRKYLY